MLSNRGPSTTAAQAHFAQVPGTQLPRSVFDRSCGLKTAFNSGDLVPIFLDEVLPGDTFNMQATCFGRFATMEKPIMDNVYLDIQFWFVPMRLLWTNFQKFMGEVDPGDTTEYLIPTLDAPVGGFLEASISDYLGIPPGEELDGLNALPYRAYERIWNDWYRDQNLQDKLTTATGDGPDSPANYELKKRGRRHDYFTSCLPWPLRGGVEVNMPLGTTAPVSYGATEPVISTGSPPTFDFDDGQTPTQAGLHLRHDANSNDNAEWSATWNPTGTQKMEWGDPNLEVDLSGGTVDLSAANSATINEMREAITLQQLLEREARGGARYTEIVKSAFGISSADSRLQRPEFLGGKTQSLTVNEVASTFEGTGQLAVLGAYAKLMLKGGFVKSFEEHGYVMGLASVRADQTYQQGVHRLWHRQTKYDYPWPELMNLGEQEVLVKEIYAKGIAADEEVFGYQERFAEYRYKPSEVTGVMRSSHSTPLDIWHLALDFGSKPVLDETFIEETPPIDRVILVGEEAEILLDIFYSYRCARIMPTFSVPGLARF